MFERRSLKWPITLGVIMIVLLALLTVGWIMLAVFGAVREGNYAALYWTMLTVGTVLLAFVVVGVVMYLTLSIKTINLNRRQSNFVDSVTHELKSPIASLKLYLQTLNRLEVKGEERASFLQFMLDDVERLDLLINQLLDAGTVDRKVKAGETEAVDITGLITDIANSVCMRYHVDPSVVVLDLQPCRVRAYRVDLDMIFRNLIDNAVKYAGAPPQVAVTLRRAPRGKVIVTVSDNGRGIPRSARGKIFGRFERLGVELERDKPGTGLGLYIVRTVVRKLGGKISLRDGEDNIGTIFEVILPAGVADTNDQEPRPSSLSTEERALEETEKASP